MRSVRYLAVSLAVLSRLVLGSAEADALTLLVPEDHATIASAMSAASSGDTVSLAPGTYAGAGNTAIDFGGKDVTLLGRSGASVTIIDCAGGRGLVLEGGETSACVIAGLTVENANTWYGTPGAAVRCVNASPCIRDCVFADNVALIGAGVYVETGTPVIVDCVFRSNRADDGGGVALRNSSGALLSGCEFEANGGQVCGVSVVNASCRILDCVFLGNLATGYSSAIATHHGLGTKIENCTFIDNHGAPIVFSQYGAPSITNCILAWNHSEHVLVCPEPTIVTKCAIFGNAGGDSLCCQHTNNIFVDPLLCGVPLGDVAPCADSPCLPMGNPWGERIGALEAGCGSCTTTVEARSWGAVKATYEDR